MFPIRQFISVLFISLVFLSPGIYSQEAPIEWEEIPKEDLAMKSFPADSNASALILCDYGVTDFDDDMYLVYKRHQRIKIFNVNGYNLATYSIAIYKDYEYMDEIEGITYSLENNGKIITTELDEDDIKEEETSEDLTLYKFTMPALKPGCVFEVRYKIITKNIERVRDWSFQYSEPVRWSEYRLIYLANIAYSAITRGYEKFYINEIINMTKVVSGYAFSYSGTRIAECNTMRMVLKDAPAIRDESFITCTADYKNNVTIQLSGWAVPLGVKYFLHDWPTFIEEMLDAPWLGKTISNSGDVEKLALKLTRGITDPDEKIKTIYNWVSNSVTWSGVNAYYANREMDDIIALKEGNSAEINLLLISLLRSAGISCDPLLLSTRENGRIQELYPIYSQFNYLIARANVNFRYYYLDATDPNRPSELLPSKILNVKSIVLKKGGVEWVTIKCDQRNTSNNLAKVKISEEGILTGSLESTFGEYSSTYLRRRLTEMNDLDVIKELLETDKYGMKIDSVAIKNRDSIASLLKTFVLVSSDEYVQTSGDLMYVNPNIFFRMDENPLKASTRKFPVDYGYKRGSSVLLDIEIPDIYEVQEQLQNRFIIAGSLNLLYSRKVNMEGNHIQILYKFDIKEVEIKPQYYELLKKFYSEIITAESDQIVLVRKVISGNVNESSIKGT